MTNPNLYQFVPATFLCLDENGEPAMFAHGADGQVSGAAVLGREGLFGFAVDSLATWFAMHGDRIVAKNHLVGEGLPHIVCRCGSVLCHVFVGQPAASEYRDGRPV